MALEQKTIQLGHGSGGQLSRELIEKLIIPPLSNEILDELGDSAVFDCPATRVAFTTDSFVVKPLFFPGGDIGKLAVCGTVNDLAAAGAIPLYLSLSLIIEAGLPTELLEEVMASAAAMAASTGVKIVTGDTKVVGVGECDKLFINTSGLGAVHPRAKLGGKRITAGDALIINGTIGDHGIAVMAKQEELAFQGKLESDCASLSSLVQAVLNKVGPAVKVMRDPTRGGLASALNELTGQSNNIEVWEENIQIKQSVNSVCEIMGLDPLYVANEGKMIFIVSREKARETLEILRAHPLGVNAAVIGEVKEGGGAPVCLRTMIGGRRVLDRLVGSQLPRIC